MTYIIIGFIFGFTIPYLARRFAKFMPATMPYALYRIFKQNKTVSKEKRSQNNKYLKLKQKYFMRSFGWGIVVSAFSFYTYITFQPIDVSWFVFLIMMLFLLMEIDNRMMLLPDLITLPLLISGFAYAAFNGHMFGGDIIVATQDSVLGAIMGYLIPTIAALFMVRKNSEAFGGGDIKLLSAIGAWVGLATIQTIILISCIVFAISCFINKKRVGAFGPSIVIATLITIFTLI
jgi:prepilin signal peptidase PulO-like enzyme (type II secretory pathway)